MSTFRRLRCARRARLLDASQPRSTRVGPVADAIAANPRPAPRYYDPRVLQRDFGRITTYQAPKPVHPGECAPAMHALQSTA